LAFRYDSTLRPFITALERLDITLIRTSRHWRWG